jgi:hypothetical protein
MGCEFLPRSLSRRASLSSRDPEKKPRTYLLKCQFSLLRGAERQHAFDAAPL